MLGLKHIIPITIIASTAVALTACTGETEDGSETASSELRKDGKDHKKDDRKHDTIDLKDLKDFFDKKFDFKKDLDGKVAFDDLKDFLDGKIDFKGLKDRKDGKKHDMLDLSCLEKHFDGKFDFKDFRDTHVDFDELKDLLDGKFDMKGLKDHKNRKHRGGKAW